MQKGQILIWIIVGALVILIAGGAYYLGRSTSPKLSATPTVISQTPQPTSTPAPDETANWKTYDASKFSAKYGTAYLFSFKYPPDWRLAENDYGSGVYLSIYSPDYQTPESLRGEVEVVTSGGRINFSFYPKTKVFDFSNLQTWADTYFPKDVKLINPKLGTINGIETIEYGRRFLDGNSFFKAFMGSDGVYEFGIISKDDPQIYAPILNQILSTFKFL